ncbi:MAG: reverse transcriptase/maturase family protein [Nanoarchaeota archaeon]
MGNFSSQDTYSLYDQVCSLQNLQAAFSKARKGKTKRSDVLEFESNLKNNLLQLRADLLLHSYRPQPLTTFIIRDPKTRKINKSAFRDRIVHHALCNILEPIYEKIFIYDSYANRKGKGTLKALERFDYFKKEVAIPYKGYITGYCFKADVKHYFETVDHDILLNIIQRRIKDKSILFLLKNILSNYSNSGQGKGMPLGNLTSQFLANVYLNELDQFAKHTLKVKLYIRYVDDFVILHKKKEVLEFYKREIDSFLQQKLRLELHPLKSKIIPLRKGITFLGFRVFYYHKLLRESNWQAAKRKIVSLKNDFDKGVIDYDVVFDSMMGWFAYAKQANTFRIREIIGRKLEESFPNQLSSIELRKIIKISVKLPRLNNPSAFKA